jgi:hypothetical protein
MNAALCSRGNNTAKPSPQKSVYDGTSPFAQAKALYEATWCALACAAASKKWNQRVQESHFKAQVRALAMERFERVRLATHEIATARGWEISGASEFTFEQLADRELPLSKPTYDERMAVARHSATYPEVGEITAPNEPFTWFTKGGLPAALLVPTYWTWQRCQDFASEKQLGVEQIEHPWHYPDKTVAVLYKRCLSFRRRTP